MNTSIAAKEANENTDTTGYVIGFATKFYTLWSENKKVVDAGGGQTLHITEYTYHGKISTSKETAMSKYPGCKVDESLRGKTRSWTHYEYVWDNVDTFRFGKYKGGAIEACTDTDYLEWYYGCVSEEHREYVADVLRSRGYLVEGGFVYSPDAQKKMAEAKDVKERIISAANSGEQVRLYIERNPDEDGCVFVSNPKEEGYLNIDNVRFFFREVVDRYYDGWTYYMPCVNGKAKRVKCKTILATISYNQEEDVFYIERFTVEKP